ncbi:MAG: hypothetical protein AB2705_22130 [Candidatus Thiodiazotropha sp.]
MNPPKGCKPATRVLAWGDGGKRLSQFVAPSTVGGKPTGALPAAAESHRQGVVESIPGLRCY